MAVVRAAHDATFNSVVAILLHSDDNSELQVRTSEVSPSESFSLSSFMMSPSVILLYKLRHVLFLHLTNILRLQNGTECLTAFVREGGEALLSWGGDADRTMGMLLDAAARCANDVYLKLQDFIGFLQSTV